MVKEWLYWGGGGASNTAKKRRSRECKETEEAPSVEAAPGCMCAVFNFWDLHNLSFTLPHQARPPSLRSVTIDDDILLQDQPSGRQGLEAPRNSLELNDKTSSSSSTSIKYDENLNIPMGIRIRTSCSGRPKSDDIEFSSSPGGTKPPNLVARLMGLDLLPENGSPSSLSRLSTSPSLTNSHLHLHVRRSNSVSGSGSGTVSLPETPRMSLARKSDVDNHRLSLQSLKENIEDKERLDVSILGGNEISVSPAHYARRIVKQVKDRVSRRVGVDITNTISNRDDRHLLGLNPNKKSALLRKVKEDSCSSNQTTPSCSPRLSFLDSKKKSQVLSSKTIKKNDDHSPKSLKVSLDVSKTDKRPVRMSNRSIKMQQQQVSDAIRSKKEEPFIRSKVSEKKYSRKTSPSKELLLNISVPSLVPKRKDLSLPITQFHDKQIAEESDAPSLKRSTQLLPSCSSRTYKQEMLATFKFPFQENIQTKCTSNNNTSFQEEESEHYQYIQTILKRIGIDKITPVSLSKCYSPLDPSIFHYLELFHPTVSSSSGPSKISGPDQRKLIFDLVDELLVEILTPWDVRKGENHICGSELIDILCKKVGEFPGANCQVLEDIDALIDMDFKRLQVGKSNSFDDLETIAMDIERHIVEKLVDETTMILHDTL